MKWIGQHIWDFISRFRGDVYLENIADHGSDPDRFLTMDSTTGKVSYRTGSEVSSDIGAGATDLSATASGTSLTVESSSGSNVALPAADTNNWGVMTDEMFDAIAANTTKTGFSNLTGEVTSSGAATTITDDTVDEANLKVSNGPSNGQVLTAQSGASGGLTWATVSSGGGGTATDLSATANGTSLTVESSDGGDVALPAATNSAWGVMSDDHVTALEANTAKNTNVSTALSAGTVNATTYGITSDGGANDIVLPEATTSVAGLLGAAKWDEIVANTAKATNVATNLSTTTSTTTVRVDSSDGTNATIPVATTSIGGVMSKAIFDQHTANVAKNTNVSTALSAGTVNATTYGITSDGGANDIVLPEATTSVAGLLGAAKWDEIVANTAKATNVDTDLTASTHASQITINSSDGDNVVIAEASGSIAGVMTVAHHDKLDGVEASADVTDATNVTAAGALMDSELTDLAGVKGVTISTLQVKPSEGAFANGDKTKLDGIEASATADQTKSDIDGLAITTVGTVDTGVWQGTAIATTYIADDAVTEDKLANTLLAEIDANTAKATNVATNLSITTSTTTARVDSSDGTNATIPVATTSVGGVMSKAIFDQHTANVAKNTNVSTDLTATANGTSLTINSSDGDNVTVPAATTSAWGIMTDDHATAVAANTAKVDLTVDGAGTVHANNYTDTTTNTQLSVEEVQDIVGGMFSSNTETRVAATYVDGGVGAGKINVVVDDMTANTTYSVQDGELSQNNFTDADHTKLNGIEASATADQTKADIDGLAITTVGTIGTGTWQGTTIKTAYIGDDQVTEDKLANTLLAEIDANTAKTSFSNLTGEVTSSGAATTIADNAVTLAKMAGIAAGRIIHGDASGDPTFLAAGSDGHVLTLASGLPSWAAAGGGSGDITSVVAGAGMTGGATSGDATLNVIGGDGITANADDIAVTAAQTAVTSMINASLTKIGTAADQEYVTFGTANEVNTFVNNTERHSVTASGVDITGALSVSGDVTGNRKYELPGTTAGDNSGGDVYYYGNGSTVKGSIYYIDGTNWSLADADAAASSTSLLAVALGTDPDVDGMLLKGFVTLLTEVEGTEAIGSVLYLSATNTGIATSTAPGSGDILRVIGHSLHATNNQVYFNPSNDFMVIA